MFSPHVGYNGWTDNLNPGEVCYLRHWKKDGNPSADRSQLMTGDNVMNGIALGVIGTILTECNEGELGFWYRQMYNSTHNIVPTDCKVISGSGWYLTDIRDGATLEKVLEIEKRVRDYIFSHTHFSNFLVADSGAAGIHNENNYPGGCPFSADLLVEYLEKCVEIWGINRVCGNLGGESTEAEPVLKRFGELGGQCVRQDAWGRVNRDGENRASMYNQRIGYIGYTPEIINLEVNGGGNAWPSKGINIQGHFDGATASTFQIAFHSNMGARCNYSEYSEFVAKINTYIQPKLNRWFRYLDIPVEPPEPTDKMKFQIEIENGIIALIQTVPTEDPQWLDAVGQSSYTFESEHHAKVTVEGSDNIPTEYPFTGWAFPPREEGSTPPDGYTEDWVTYFRTEGRDTEALDVVATYEGYPPGSTDCCEEHEERLDALDESVQLLHQKVLLQEEEIQENTAMITDLQGRLGVVEDRLSQGSLVKELI